MAEYIFSNGQVTVAREATLRSERWQPHVLQPAFLVLDVNPIEEKGKPPDEQVDGEDEDGTRERKSEIGRTTGTGTGDPLRHLCPVLL